MTQPASAALLVFSALLLSPDTAPASPQFEGPQKEIDAIVDLFGRMSEYRDAGEVDQVIALHHPDIRIMTRGRKLLSGPDGVREFYGANYQPGSSRKLYADLTELRVFGNVAMVVGRFLASDPDKQLEDPGYYLIVLRKNDQGQWRIYRDIDTPSPDGLILKPPSQQ